VFIAPLVYLAFMIQLERLRAIKHIVSHYNCADGTASAMILKDVLPNADVQFVQYGTEEQLKLPAIEGMIFADFSPHISRVKDFLDVGTIVLDHHGGPAEAITKMFIEQGLGAFASETTNPGRSGALLAYDNVWLPLSKEVFKDNDPVASLYHLDVVRTLAVRAGIYDTWQKKDPLWITACEQKEALSFWSWEKIKATPYDLWQSELLAAGPALFQRNLSHVKKCIKGAHTFTTGKGVRVMLFEGTKPSSDAAEMAESVDLVVGTAFYIDAGEPKMVFSTRSRTNFNCRALALAHGGNGHIQAAGFAWTLSPGDPNPYSLIETILERYESVESIWKTIVSEPGFDRGVAEGTINPKDIYQNLVLNRSFQTLTPPSPTEPIP
jgi:hypothetical protein